MPKADCTKVQLAIYQMAMNVASRTEAVDIDDVVAAIRKDFSVFSRDTIIEAISQATTREAQESDELMHKLSRISRQARLETATIAKIDTVQKALREGELPAETQARKIGPNTQEQLRQTLLNLRQWHRTADPAMQKQLEAKLADLTKHAEAGDILLTEQREKELHENVQAIQDQIEAVKSAMGEKRVVAALQEKIEELRGHLEAGTVPAKAAARQRGTGMADQLRDLRDDLKKQIARSEPAQRANLERAIALLDSRIATGDIAPKTRPKPPSTPELDRLRYEADIRRNQIRQMRQAAVPKTRIQQFRSLMHFFLPIKAGMEFSQVLNQGGRRFFGHPVQSVEILAKTLKGMTNPAYMAKLNRDITEHPVMPILYRAGYRPSAVAGISTGPQEELYWGSVLERIPIIKQFSQAFATYLNLVRFGAMVDFARNWTLTGEPTLEEAQMIVKGVQQFTGRGTLGKEDRAAGMLDSLLWAPRLVAGHFQTLMGFPLIQTRGAARAYFAAEYARWLGGLLTFLFLGWLDGWEIEWNPTSANVLGLRKGNVTINPLGGMATVVSLIGRHIAGSYEHPVTGQQVPLRGEGVQFGKMAMKDIEFNFLDWKLHPTIASGLALVRQEKFGSRQGEPVTVQGELLDAVTNITYRDIYQINHDSDLGMPDAVMATLLALFGMKVQVYGENR